MVASCASSRGHIGLTGGPWVGGGGGAAGFICAKAPELSARPPNRAAQARIRPGKGAVKFFGISGHYEELRSRPKTAADARLTYPLRGAASRRFRGTDVAEKPFRGHTLPLAGDGDIFVADTARPGSAGFMH